MQIGIHPAPGFGELLPAGTFVVPSNPLKPASYVPHIGELLPAMFTLPENPIVRELSGISSLRPGATHPSEDARDSPYGLSMDFPGQGHAYGRGHPVRTRTGWNRNISMSGIGECGCISGMCGEACEGLGGLGLGQLDLLGSLGSYLPWILGGGLVLWMLSRPGGAGYRRDLEQAGAEYQSKVSKARSRHRGYKRLARPVASRVQSGLRAVTT